ncbi:Imm26 family immunity protein [Amycolatopsis halotolerans]|uniref:Imm26 family immunity protein n=1 Tax=Amycolatopsis halotolerans TaxID=330083 RepID=A0ABV7QE05_9PSEU
MTRRGAKQKYREGDWFAVPLESGKYAVGLIARSTKKSHSIFFGYFFGPARAAVPSLSDIEGLRPDDAIWLSQFGDIGLHDGTWPVLGQSPGWDRADWPMPAFAHKDALIPDRYVRREYPNEDPGIHSTQQRISAEDAATLPEDGLAGSGFVEQRLTKLLT